MPFFKPGSNHEKASLDGTQVHDESILAVTLDGASMRDTKWTECSFDNDGMDGVTFRGADLTGAEFVDCHFEILHAEGLQAEGVVFRRCSFGFANFSESHLEGAIFEDVRAANGLYFNDAKCRGMQLSLLADAVHEPGTVHLVSADLRGATLSARLTDDEAKRIRDNEFREMTWSEFTMQKAKTDDATRFEYGPLPFDDEPKKPTPKRKLGKRSAVLPHDEWGTIASLTLVADLVFTGEGGWNGDARRYGAKGSYRVAGWRGGARMWETKLLAGSGTENVHIVASSSRVYAIATDVAFVLDAETGRILSREELSTTSRWVEPGVIAILDDDALVRELGASDGSTLRVDWVDCASPDGTLVWAQVGYDADVGDYVWSIRSRTDEHIATRAGQATSACFSGESSRHASAWNKANIEIRDARSGELVLDFAPAPEKKRQPEVRALSMSHDGAWLAGACGPTQVVVWDARTGDVCVKHSKLEPPIEAIAFSRDAKQLYVGTGLAKEARCVSVFPL